MSCTPINMYDAHVRYCVYVTYALQYLWEEYC